MNFFKSFSLLVVALCFALFMTSCGEGHDHHNHEGHDHDATHTHAAHGEGANFTSAYVCPMHCEGSGSDQEGKCPVCGMEYVLLEDHAKDGHTH